MLSKILQGSEKLICKLSEASESKLIYLHRKEVTLWKAKGFFKPQVTKYSKHVLRISCPSPDYLQHIDFRYS